ncbi:MAG: hypothetical protein E7231_06925 [Cellulosilyticum sp.]|nr:hypothetical protein [Cellulosilyticum sp.]
MLTIYWYCLIIGIVFLLLSLILDVISDLFQGLSFFDFHYDLLPGILPLTPLQFCAFLVGFGGMGITLRQHTSFHCVLSILFGLILSYGTYWLLHKLKNVDSEALTNIDIIGCEGKVIVTIFENGIGSVSLNTKIGKITYSAKSDHYIKQGSLVKVLDIKDSILIVSDTSTYFLNLTKNKTL